MMLVVVLQYHDDDRNEKFRRDSNQELTTFKSRIKIKINSQFVMPSVCDAPPFLRHGTKVCECYRLIRSVDLNSIALLNWLQKQYRYF